MLMSHSSRRRRVSLAGASGAMLVCLGLSGHADAAMIYDTLGSPPAYDASAAALLSKFEDENAHTIAGHQGDRFIVGGTGIYALTSITLPMGITGEGSAARVRVQLYSDSAGAPDDALLSTALELTASATPELFTLTMPAGVNVSAGSAYWVIATPTDLNTEVSWYFGSDSTRLATRAYMLENQTTNDRQWYTYQDSAALAVAVEGTAVPEPSTALVLITASAQLLLRRRRA